MKTDQRIVKRVAIFIQKEYKELPNKSRRILYCTPKSICVSLPKTR
ncbi:hypothetical protein PORCRE_1735 [Porphyromonas crevioricanis JCM 15906]|uniref:Uncharacterized protein n=1 Tax=Porphyromonas crevioricanis JCM 15906 TaxID=1305617 RepID=T1DT54_9PORP|nr:hypothetical protein PORCRE_1735 [Porphyromonas crevioricanis JCM 15906]GAD06434.1 hypothetical protein PORCAN_30 [Porphyromonas crevioricanis JCM 13913]